MVADDLKPSTQAFNSKVLSHFNSLIYKDVITEDNLVGNEIAISLDSNDSNRYAGYVFKKGLKQYFLQAEYVDELPIRIKKTHRMIDGKLVYHAINKEGFSSVRVPAEDSISFRELVDWFCNFKHTHPTQFTLWKIIIISAYISRVNFRLATNGGFGKDSVIDALRDLTNNACRIDKATFAKLEYVAKFPLIICNEVASLKKAEHEDFESFGLSAGAFQNKYTKRSRKTSGTKEILDISRLSLGFTFNHARSYLDKGEKCFDQIFRKEFLERFLPLKFEGWVDVEQFKTEGHMDFKVECKDNMPAYKAIIKQIAFLLENAPTARFEVLDGWKFPRSCGKHKRSFKVILLYVGLYAKDKEEYECLGNELYGAYERYLEEEVVLEGRLDVKEEKVM